MHPSRMQNAFHYNTLYLNLCVHMCTGDAGSLEQWWSSVCSEDAEERCHTTRWRRGVHHDREASVGSGLQSPIPHTPVLLFSDRRKCLKQASNSGPTTAQSYSDFPCSNEPHLSWQLADELKLMYLWGGILNSCCNAMTLNHREIKNMQTKL